MQELIEAATFLCQMLIPVVVLLSMRLMLNMFNNKSNTIKIDGAVTKDNIFTQQAAAENAKAAAAQQKAAEANLEAEQVRLERVRLELKLAQSD